jgi:hypothetical protein
MELAGLAMIVQKQLEAEDMAKQGNYAGAQGAMSHLGGILRSCKLDTHAAACDSIGSKLASHAIYASSTGYLKSFSKGASAAYSVSGMDDAAQDVLRSMHVDMCNSAQDSVLQSFTSDEMPVKPSSVVGSISVNVVPADANAAWKVAVASGGTSDTPKLKVSKKKSKRW